MYAQFTLGRRRMGMSPAAAATSFNPITAGIGAGVGLATAAASMWMQNNVRKNNAKSATTAIVNGLEEQLRNLRDAYLSERNPSCADQRAALNLYDEAWAWLQSPAACGQQGFGSAGDACVADRAPGGRWPWKSYYRDPMATDPRMAELGCDTGLSVLLPNFNTGTYMSTGITSTGGSTQTGANAAQIQTPAAAIPAAPSSGSTSTPLLIGAAALAAFAIAKAL